MTIAIAASARAKDSPAARRIDPRVDPRAWVRNNERISNEGDREGWIALYAPEVVFEAITDGSYERRAGLEQMRDVVHVMCTVLAKHRLRVQKRFIVGTPEVVVNGWIGGFGDRQRQHGVEIWTLRAQDGLVARHEMYTYCDVRPGTSLIGRLRVLFAGEARVKLALGAGERRARSKSARERRQ